MSSINTNTSTSLSDEELIEKIVKTGKSELFGQLYDRYANKVYRKCLSMIKDYAAAQDLSHDILIKAFMNLSRFQGKSRFSSWIYAITYNRCIDYLREKKKFRTVEVDDNFDDQDEEYEDSGEFLLTVKAERLKVLMERLAEEDRLILLMKYQDEMSIAEIQESLELKSSAVKMRLLRARDRLLHLYKEYYSDQD